jgi:hypothetical protein
MKCRPTDVREATVQLEHASSKSCRSSRSTDRARVLGNEHGNNCTYTDSLNKELRGRTCCVSNDFDQCNE